MRAERRVAKWEISRDQAHVISLYSHIGATSLMRAATAHKDGRNDGATGSKDNQRAVLARRALELAVA